MIAIEPATFDHVLDLAPRMRAEDRREIWASRLMTPHRALMASIRAAPAWCWIAGESVQCMFGIVPSRPGTGIPWLLGSEDLPNRSFSFLRACRPIFSIARQGYALLFNYVDARNRLSLAWLRWLGFSSFPAVPMGPFSLPFHRFEMRVA